MFCVWGFEIILNFVYTVFQNPSPPPYQEKTYVGTWLWMQRL